MNKFVFGRHLQGNDIVWLKGIPFSILKKDDMIKFINHLEGAENSITINESCEVLFFLGMVTDKPECCEWWGQNERYYYNGTRLFIGDKIGRINIVYADDTMETIPVIFGVNVWPYELLNGLKENEAGLNHYWGPFNEPFIHDTKAARLMEEALVLMENDSEKGMKYIFGLKVKDKIVREITLSRESYKEAGFVVSAVTGLKRGNLLDEAWRVVDSDFFLRKEYFPAMDKLARRLYQFRDEIPGHIETSAPSGYVGPMVKFSGKAAADIFTNVFSHNLFDMSENKVDNEGMTHTSSPETLSFGGYVGLGTYKNARNFYTHIWSRDVGRTLIELAKTGVSAKLPLAAKALHRYLYDGCVKFLQPHWKRIANGSELGDESLFKSLAGKENDGHATLMLFIYNLYACGAVDRNWLEENKKEIIHSAEWLFWQIENPKESNFDKVLYSESEASSQKYGGYDLFSNTYACYALKAYAILASAINYLEFAEKCDSYSTQLRNGIMEKFTAIHPRFGRIFVDTIDDCWTWEYKRFAPLFLMTDIYSYDPAEFDCEWYNICSNTYSAQKEDYFSYAAGRQMGYGQGYLTETAILLDEYEDMTGCLEQTAYFCYHHTDSSYIVPEGVVMHPSGRFWFRNGDLGNGVQQGEIIKCARLLAGLDDNNLVKGLDILPRLPDGWTGIEVSEYKIAALSAGCMKSIPVSMRYERWERGYMFSFSAFQPIKVGRIRIGPFNKAINKVNINIPYKYEVIERKGRIFIYIEFGSENTNCNLLCEQFDDKLDLKFK